MARGKELAKKGATSEEVLSGYKEQLKAAQTIEDILDAGALYNADDVLGEALVITGFEEQQGDFGPYALIWCDKPDANGELHGITVSCGGEYVMEALRTIAERDMFPFTGRFERKETNQGFRVYRIRSVK